jgi:hypothetical protein
LLKIANKFDVEKLKESTAVVSKKIGEKTEELSEV